MDSFSKGEIAIYVGSCFPEQECEITDPLGEHIMGRDGYFDKEGRCFREAHYGIRFADGTELWAIPTALRKKKPPQREMDTVISWDECIWRPEHDERLV